jgi:hypothetical protein
MLIIVTTILSSMVAMLYNKIKKLEQKFQRDIGTLRGEFQRLSFELELLKNRCGRKGTIIKDQRVVDVYE